MAYTPTKRVADITADIFRNTLTLTFSNGKTLVVETDRLSDEIKLQAMMHGLKQKLVDAGAISRDTLTGKSATLNDKFDAINEIHARITSPHGTWNKVRTDGSGPNASGGLLCRALMQLTGKGKEAILAFLDGKTPAEKAALRKNEKVAAIIIQLQIVKTGEDTTVDNMIDGLMGDEEAQDDVDEDDSDNSTDDGMGSEE